MRLAPEVYSIMSGIADVLTQAARADGFADIPHIDWNFFSLDCNNAFRERNPSITGTAGRIVGSHVNLYERVLMSNLGELGLDTKDLLVRYMLKDTHKGTRIEATIDMWINHPPQYLEAMEQAGSLRHEVKTEKTTFIQCELPDNDIPF